MKRQLLFTFLFVLASLLNAQNIEDKLLTKNWRAYWVTVPGIAPNDFGVYRFRKELELKEKPETYVVHVSADERYKLYVNEQLVSLGPALGDINNKNFETVDIAPFLQAGKNIIAAVVWNEGKLKAVVYVSYSTGFILQGNTRKEYAINTNSRWMCSKDEAYRPIEQKPAGYYALGPGESVDMNLISREWMSAGYDAGNWLKAEQISPGVPKASNSLIYSPWLLTPSTLPQMELKPQRLQKTHLVNGIKVPKGFPAVKSDVTIPANSKAVVLLDQAFLTNAYPTLVFSKGKGATVAMQYAEALYDSTNAKGNRDVIEGKRIIGRIDSIISNGKANQQYTPLSWRTYRYLQLDIQTKDEPLVLNDIYGTFIGYPFNNKTSINANSELLDSILKIGWRTARLCAVETYMDCPFYEQLQYIGDTRIQALVSYYNSGDDRLARNAINLIDNSRLPEGVTQSRYPANKLQVIPPFSLLWIGMVHDFYQYRPDAEFVKSKLAGIRQVLSFFANYQQEDESLKGVPYWNFTDWAENISVKWKNGVPPISANGYSSILDMQLLWALQLASEMEANLGKSYMAKEYADNAARLKQTIIAKYWSGEKQMFADTDDKEYFSEHANTLAILTGCVSGQDAVALYNTMKSDKSLTQASIYFQYYVNQGMVKVGLGNQYLEQLDIWKKNISLGMTTWGEDSNVERTRSDCHAWGASPNIEFFRTVLGIDSNAPGFSKVKIEPHLGDLADVNGSVPHPYGKITVSYTLKKNKWLVEIVLPEKTEGIFIWAQKEYKLQPGENQFEL